MVITRHALTNGRFHQTGQGGEHVDRWENALGVKLTVKVDLSLCDISSQIRNRVGNIVVRHRQNGQLRNRPVSPHNTSCPLVDSGQIGIHITRVTTPSRNLLPRGRNLTQSISVRTHIRQDDQHVQIPLVGQILSSRQREPGGNDTFNRRIVCQVQEQGGTLHGTTLLEIGSEKTGSFHIHSHSTKHNGEVLLVRISGILQLNEGGLTGNLSGNLIMGQSSSRKNGDFLSTGNRVHDINGRNTSLDHGLGIITRGGVDGLPVDIQVGLRKDLGTGINDLTGSVEGSSKHLLGHSHFEDVAGEFTASLSVVNVGCSLEDLHDGA
mmetsp:Transcript_17593/g.38076  ORF Transcript_17593/g.38076 Transcript_17593/m.38076 type:complete len:323 (-) Transcript_17593:344-1312(-)